MSNGFNHFELDYNKKTILIVDDEVVILNLLKDILDMLGYNVVLCISPEEALEVFSHYRKSIDLIIMDMMMPRMNGLQLYRKICQVDSNNKVILLSGYSMVQVTAQLLDEGVVGFMQKPVTIKKLEEAIQKALS
ncbi:response regulator [Petrocella sp. FN5]|uniref:response regulator n=1 Tax=Petrocella sp. FN5 TaxID=3032002 RepID=UPI0023DAE397|nr:response regulator [Petrocella sp. FN5]MDF1617706.1 response regulator [Petrocella sp. FN5]